MEMTRGDVYWADLEPTQGGEMKIIRPAVIVSNNGINNNASVVIICPITEDKGKTSPIHIFVPKGEGGLTKDSIVHCGQVRAVDKNRIGEKCGKFSLRTMREISEGLIAAMTL
jgi:mRNA interferase MazF